MTDLALVVGVISGIYGIGGGSLLGPLLALTSSGSIAPVWSLGLACGLASL